MARLNKWLFKDFRFDVKNFNYLKTLPFCTFSDLKDPNYSLIGEILEYIKFDKNKFINIGKSFGPFGININIEDSKKYNELLNSCQFSFIFTKNINETSYLIQSVLAGIIPICNLNHLYIKPLGLISCATLPDKSNVLDKLSEIMYKKNIYHNKIYWLGWQYYQKIQKWNKLKNNKSNE